MARTQPSRRQLMKAAAAIGTSRVLGSTALASAASSREMVSVRPTPCAGAFANPLKGFRPDIPNSPEGIPDVGFGNPLISVARHYIQWNQLENAKGDSIHRIIDFFNQRWAGVEKRNIKIIPRVYLYWPSPVEEFYWPSDLQPNDYGSTRFLERLARLIGRLGETWDRDPRVAYVETGFVGPCGEQWGPTPHEELRKVIGDSYTAAFKNKLCMVRYPWMWTDYRFGVFWDSWGTNKDTARMLESLEGPPLRDSWKTCVRGGEISYGFGDPPGNDPDDSLRQNQYVDWIECLVRRGHWNHLGWISYYNWKRPELSDNAQRLQRGYGYRFELEEVSYPANVEPGGSLGVKVVVRNVGSSPLYYHWPVEISLLHEQTREPLWKAMFPDVDPRQWLPGDHWMQFAKWNAEQKHFVLDDKPGRYEKQPESHTVAGRFQLPANLPKGRHILALAILDPAGMLPSCRFATSQYFNGGRHPIGQIGIGVELDRAELASNTFDDPSRDTTLRYQI